MEVDLCLNELHYATQSMDTKFFYTDGNKGFKTIESFCLHSDDDSISLEDCVDQCISDLSLCPLEYDATVDVYGASYWLSLGLGCMLIMVLVLDIILYFLPKKGLQSAIPPTSSRQEATVDDAASHQMSRFLSNTLSLQHGQEDSILDDTTRRSLKRMGPTFTMIDRFQMLPKRTETVGGIFWVWKKILDGSLFSEEGVWISGRVLACNFAQLMVVGMVIFFTRFWMSQKGDILYSKTEVEYNDYVSSIQLDLDENPEYQAQLFVDDLTQFATCTQTLLQVNLGEIWPDWRDEWWSIGSRLVQILNEVFDSQGLEVILIERDDLDECLAETENLETIFQYLLHTEIVSNHETDFLKDITSELDISHQEFNAGSWMALAAGCLVSLSTAIVLIPAYVSSVLKFRSGFTPSLADREFLRYRFAPDVITTLIGSAFWGTFFTSVAAMGLAVAIAVRLSLTFKAHIMVEYHSLICVQGFLHDCRTSSYWRGCGIFHHSCDSHHHVVDAQRSLFRGFLPFEASRCKHHDGGS